MMSAYSTLPTVDPETVAVVHHGQMGKKVTEELAHCGRPRTAMPVRVHFGAAAGAKYARICRPLGESAGCWSSTCGQRGEG